MTLKLLVRSITLLIAAMAGMAAILFVPGFTHPSGAQPGTLIDWWESVGTPSATIALLRSVMLAVLGYVVVVALLVTAASIASLGARPLSLPRLAPPTLRRYLAGGGIIVAALSPSPLRAQEGIPISLVDLGPAHAATTTDVGAAIIAVDLGPALDSDNTLPSAAFATQEIEISPVAEPIKSVWVVSRGDHLWSIAADTVLDHRSNASDQEIASYWRRLISTNHDAVGSDPDLINPGQQIMLPPL